MKVIDSLLKNSLPLIVGALTLSGCSKGIEEGKVISKEYEPERVYTTTGMMLVGEMMMPVTMRRRDDEDFIFKVEGLNKEGKIDTASFYVSSKLYDSLGVGDYFCFKGDCAEKSDPETKEKVKK